MPSKRSLAPEAVRADGTRIALGKLHGVTAVAALPSPAFHDMRALSGVEITKDRRLARPDDLSSPRKWTARSSVTEKDAVKLWRGRPDAWAGPSGDGSNRPLDRSFDRAIMTDGPQMLELRCAGDKGPLDFDRGPGLIAQRAPAYPVPTASRPAGAGGAQRSATKSSSSCAAHAARLMASPPHSQRGRRPHRLPTNRSPTLPACDDRARAQRPRSRRRARSSSQPITARSSTRASGTASKPCSPASTRLRQRQLAEACTILGAGWRYAVVMCKRRPHRPGARRCGGGPARDNAMRR